MPVLGTFPKQPADVQDYDIDYSEYCAGFTPADTLTGTPVVTADPGITVASTTRVGNVVKVFLSGGTSGVTYKVTCRATTTGGRVKEVEIKVKVKED